MQDAKSWLMPEYYDQFLCKCGSCRNNCCGRWSIAIGRTEYYRLIGLDCSEELHHRLECAFHAADNPSPERFQLISPNWRGECPMLDTDRLCMLQKECGEGALSVVCRVYPRSLKRDAEVQKACCSNSCEAVIETLISNAEPLKFKQKNIPLTAEIEAVKAETTQAEKMACIRALQNRDLPIAERLRTIAQQFAPETASDGAALRRQSRGREAPETDAFAPDAQALLKLLELLNQLCPSAPALAEYGETALRRYANGDALRRYVDDAHEFELRNPHWRAEFENILANHLFYEDYPDCDRRVPAKDSYIGLWSAYALMRLIAVSYTAEHPGRDALADALSGIFRTIEHSPFYYNCCVLVENPEALLGF